LNVNIDTAAAIIKRGGVVAYPTEGVYGLGCDPLNIDAVQRLITIKGRAADKGLILIAASLGQIEPFLQPISNEIQARLAEHWPGPVTWIMPCNDQTPALVRGGRETLAVRVTDHPVAAELCNTCGHALVSTSANHSGAAPCLDAATVALTLGAEIDAIIDAPLGSLNGPTPIFDATTGKQLR
jgi:L-threonylcarbamoyladenylate synthase